MWAPQCIPWGLEGVATQGPALSRDRQGLWTEDLAPSLGVAQAAPEHFLSLTEPGGGLGALPGRGGKNPGPRQTPLSLGPASVGSHRSAGHAQLSPSCRVTLG